MTGDGKTCHQKVGSTFLYYFKVAPSECKPKTGFYPTNFRIIICEILTYNFGCEGGSSEKDMRGHTLIFYSKSDERRDVEVGCESALVFPVGYHVKSHTIHGNKTLLAFGNI